MMRFYIALPSDSSTSYFLENTISGYTTKLPGEIVSVGDWECGVSEVRYPKTFYNVEGCEISITKVKNIKVIMHLNQSFWEKDDLIAELNNFVGTEGGKINISNVAEKHLWKSELNPFS